MQNVDGRVSFGSKKVKLNHSSVSDTVLSTLSYSQSFNYFRRVNISYHFMHWDWCHMVCHRVKSILKKLHQAFCALEDCVTRRPTTKIAWPLNLTFPNVRRLLPSLFVITYTQILSRPSASQFLSPYKSKIFANYPYLHLAVWNADIYPVCYTTYNKWCWNISSHLELRTKYNIGLIS